MWFCAVIKIGIARIGCDGKCDDALATGDGICGEKKELGRD